MLYKGQKTFHWRVVGAMKGHRTLWACWHDACSLEIVSEKEVGSCGKGALTQIFKNRLGFSYKIEHNGGLADCAD